MPAVERGGPREGLAGGRVLQALHRHQPRLESLDGVERPQAGAEGTRRRQGTAALRPEVPLDQPGQGDDSRVSRVLGQRRGHGLSLQLRDGGAGGSVLHLRTGAPGAVLMQQRRHDRPARAPLCCQGPLHLVVRDVGAVVQGRADKLRDPPVVERAHTRRFGQLLDERVGQRETIRRQLLVPCLVHDRDDADRFPWLGRPARSPHGGGRDGHNQRCHGRDHRPASASLGPLPPGRALRHFDDARSQIHGR